MDMRIKIQKVEYQLGAQTGTQNIEINVIIENVQNLSVCNLNV